MTEKYSTIGGWVVAIAKALNNMGIEVQPILDEVGISSNEYINPDFRVNAQKLNKIIDLAIERTGDPCFAVRISNYVHPSTFSVLGYSMLASGSLYEVLQKLSRFKRIVSETCILSLKESGDEITLTMEVQDDLEGHPVVSHDAVIAFFAAVIKFLKELASEDFHARRISFTSPYPLFHERLEEYFQCRISYDAEQPFAVFDKQALIEPLPTSNPDIVQLHEKVLIDYMSQLDKSDLSMQVQNIIMKSLSLGAPNQADVAKSLNMSLRNLQRKLSAEGTSFKDIMDTMRHELALQYVKQPSLSLGEISYLLGFSSVTNFARAFKRWTQQTPGQYRESVAGRYA